MENKNNELKKENLEETLEKNNKKKKILIFALILLILIIFLIFILYYFSVIPTILSNNSTILIFITLFLLTLAWASISQSKIAKIILNIFCICIILGFIYFIVTIFLCINELSKCPG